MNIDLYLFGGVEQPIFYDIEPLKKTRDWMDSIKDSGIYKCLPIRIGNEMGWSVKTKFILECEWNGSSDTKAMTYKIKIRKKHKNLIDIYNKIMKAEKSTREAANEEWAEYDLALAKSVPASTQTIEDFQIHQPVSSHFGYGIFTFNLPWIIRTSPNYGVYARGPTNFYKEGVLYMDAYIETDWLNNTFAYNIKLQKSNQKIIFNEGEEIFCFMPYKIKALKEANINYFDIKKCNRYLDNSYENFKKERMVLYKKKEDTGETIHQLDYFKGGTKSTSKTKSVGCPFKHFTTLDLATLNLNLKSPILKNKIRLITFLRNIRESSYRAFWFFRKIRSQIAQR